jgi:hypothetical protein
LIPLREAYREILNTGHMGRFDDEHLGVPDHHPGHRHLVDLKGVRWLRGPRQPHARVTVFAIRDLSRQPMMAAARQGKWAAAAFLPAALNFPHASKGRHQSYGRIAYHSFRTSAHSHTHTSVRPEALSHLARLAFQGVRTHVASGSEVATRALPQPPTAVRALGSQPGVSRPFPIIPRPPIHAQRWRRRRRTANIAPVAGSPISRYAAACRARCASPSGFTTCVIHSTVAHPRN